MITVGIVGHRFLANRSVESFVVQQCTSILQQLRDKHQQVMALSAIAEGADSIFAETALSLNIPLKIVRPFLYYKNDFTDSVSKDCYHRLRSAALYETILPYTMRSVSAYLAAMHWVVNRSDLLLAVWNGQFTGGKGGTADAVKKVMQDKNNWIHLDVTNLSTRYFFYHTNILY